MSANSTTASSLIVEIDSNTTAALRPAARARDLPVRSLVISLIEAIARDSLVDAVLDDDKAPLPPPAPPRKVGHPPKS
jgi:hypothetical protein